ncbi:MAG: membrane protein insertase YidC [Gammaproteobacteria bacterium]|nr:membrane protein insertase YidC [Gammaproteobacteria bacterium]
MDNQRLLIWAIFAFLGWITYQTWVQDYGPKPVAPAAEQAGETVSAPGITAVDEELPAIADVAQADTVPGAAGVATDLAATSSAPTITVSTDVFDIVISTAGGTLQGATLKGYPVAKDQPDTLVRLLATEGREYSLIESGVRAADGAAEATHLVDFDAARRSYELGDAEELIVPLTWQDESGVTVEKRYRFERGSYVVGLEQVVTNGSPTPWRGAEYVRIKGRSTEIERSMFDVDTYSFVGPIVYNGDKSEKLKHDDLIDDGKFEFSSPSGWVGSIQHHFLRAAVPARGTEYKYEVQAAGDTATSSAIRRSLVTISPGSTETFATTLFIGPKLQEQLEQVDETLKLTVDYGWLTIISQPLFWLLSFVYGYVQNWGVAIILVTFLIKLAFYKLTESSGRSMAKMRQIQPRMKALQDRYKDDKQALSQAMMDLYKREKVNPAAGCLPILIQMPFFLAFYWVLLESVEMRQAPFALWITDLSTRDPYFILPLIMGAAMFGQQKLNPAPADPVQAKVMQVMPVMFTVFFAFFPSGLVLYWVTNTLLSIAQQWNVNRVVEAETKAQKAGKKGG